MPIYEYRCRNCGARFEVLVYSEGKEIVCDQCGSEDSERLMSGFAAAGTSSTSSSCAGSGGFT